MSDELPRAVLDTVVFVQYLISGRGPSAACLEVLRAGRFVLLMRQDTPEGREFCQRFPTITILSPVQFLGKLQPSETSG